MPKNVDTGSLMMYDNRDPLSKHNFFRSMIMSSNNFDGRVTVVTGGASGIGAAIARKFGKMGSRIALLDLDGHEAAREAEDLKAQGIEAIGLKCDVSSEKQCSDAVKKVIKTFGGIDVLVNNAGITQRSVFTMTDMSVYKKIMDVNFFGTLYCTKAAISSLIERKGVIVVTTSIAGIAPLLGRTGYSASKHALHGFFESLRSEVKFRGVHVMMLCPGFTRTNLQSKALDGDGSLNTKDRSIAGNEATPESVADAVFKGVIKRKRELILTPVGKLSSLVIRFFPSFYERMMIRSVKAEFTSDL